MLDFSFPRIKSRKFTWGWVKNTIRFSMIFSAWKSRKIRVRPVIVVSLFFVLVHAKHELKCGRNLQDKKKTQEMNPSAKDLSVEKGGK